MEPQAKPASPPRGVSQRTVGIVCSALFFAVGLVMMADNYRIGAGWTREGPASGYFPFRIGAIICIASIALLLQILADKQGGARLFVSWDRFKRVLSVLLPTMAFVLAIQLVGIYVAAALFIAAFMRVMDRYGWLKTVATGVGVSAVLFWLFEVQFMVPLPKGPLEALFGY